MDYAYSSFNGHGDLSSAEVLGSTGAVIERVTFTRPSSYGVHQNEAALYVSDEWNPFRRLTVTYGLRSDTDSVTEATHVSPRAGVILALTNDGKTLLKAGGGIFYDRIPLMAPGFESLPVRTVSLLDPDGQLTSSASYVNRITGNLQNPRSTAWNVALERQVTSSFTVRVGFEDRNTARSFVINPYTVGNSGVIALSNGGNDSYREFQATAAITVRALPVNGSYVHSRAYGTLMIHFSSSATIPRPSFSQTPAADCRSMRPTEFLFWGDVQGPWKLTITPVWDMHTGFPYSVQNEYREYIGHAIRPVSIVLLDRPASHPAVSRCTWVTVNSRCARILPYSTFSTTTIPATCRPLSTAETSAISTTPHGESTAES